MPDFPYTRARNWKNVSEGASTGDPVADAGWFEDLEAAVHQGQDHEKQWPLVGSPTDGQIAVWDAAANAGAGAWVPEAAPSGGGSGGTSAARAFSAYNTANRTMTQDEEKLTFDSELYDTHSGFDLATDEYVVGAAGYFHFEAHCYLTGVPTDAYVQLVLYRGTTPLADLDISPGRETTEDYVSGSKTVPVALNERYSVWIYVYSVSNTVIMGGSGSTRFEGHYVGSA